MGPVAPMPPPGLHVKPAPSGRSAAPGARVRRCVPGRPPPDEVRPRHDGELGRAGPFGLGPEVVAGEGDVGEVFVAQGPVEGVPARDGRGRDGAGADRGGRARDLASVVLDGADARGPRDHGVERAVGGTLLDGGEAALGGDADARREAMARQVDESAGPMPIASSGRARRRVGTGLTGPGEARGEAGSAVHRDERVGDARPPRPGAEPTRGADPRAIGGFVMHQGERPAPDRRHRGGGHPKTPRP